MSFGPKTPNNNLCKFRRKSFNLERRFQFVLECGVDAYYLPIPKHRNHALTDMSGGTREKLLEVADYETVTKIPYDFS